MDISIIDIAKYIIAQYYKIYGCFIDEMKLHKLLYFSQREYMVEYGEVMFGDQFEAWKYGPVMTQIRDIYPFGLSSNITAPTLPQHISNIIDRVLTLYGNKRSWNLSTLTHNEISWLHAREGIPVNTTVGKKMLNTDILEDANRVRLRRFIFSTKQ